MFAVEGPAAQSTLSFLLKYDTYSLKSFPELRKNVPAFTALKETLQR